MKVKDCGTMDEIFTHIDEDTHEVRHFNATAMSAAAEFLVTTGQVDFLTVAIDHEFVDFVKNRRGVEDWKIKRLCEPHLSKPIVGALMRDGSVLTVDGHHRMIRWADAGKETYEIYVFHTDTWQGYLVTDMPSGLEDLLVDEVKDQLR